MSPAEEKIVFSNMQQDHECGWYREYLKSPRSLGSVLHWLYVYCGLRVAERVTVGNDLVKLNDLTFAEITWDGKQPVFRFHPTGEAHRYYTERQRIWLTHTKGAR